MNSKGTDLLDLWLHSYSCFILNLTWIRYTQGTEVSIITLHYIYTILHLRFWNSHMSTHSSSHLPSKSMIRAVVTNRGLQHKIFLQKVLYSAWEFVFCSHAIFERKLLTMWNTDRQTVAHLFYWQLISKTIIQFLFNRPFKIILGRTVRYFNLQSKRWLLHTYWKWSLMHAIFICTVKDLHTWIAEHNREDKSIHLLFPIRKTKSCLKIY